MRKMRFLLILLAIIAGLGLFAGVIAGSQTLTRASDGPSLDVNPNPPKSSGEWVVARLYYESQADLDAIAGSLDIWEVNRKEGYVVAALPPAQSDWLEALGYRMEVETEKTSILNGPQAVLDPRFHYFDDEFVNPNGLYIVDFLQEVSNTYPELTQLIDIGNAWQGENGLYNRDMWVLRVTNEDPAYGAIEDKPPFFLFSTIHAREVATPELAIRYIKYVTSGHNGEGGYGLDADVTWLVNHHVLYVLVMQNPDGYRVNEEDTSVYRRKNMDSDDGCGSQSLWGVDLNRNHSFLWGCCGGSTGEPCDEIYRGPSEASEPETYYFQDFFATVIPDQNGPNGNNEVPPAAPITTTGFFISLHSYADEILWPWYLPGIPPAPNFQELVDIGRKLAFLTGYYPAGTVGYTVDGSSNYWAYGKFGIPAYTYEVGPNYGACGGFFPAYECIEGEAGYPQNFWAENKPSFIYAHKISRTPYINVYGPDAVNLSANPGVVPSGQPVELGATILDQRYGADPLQPVAAAEYFIDAPGEDGSGIAMNPADGGWGGTSEQVTATLDTSSLALGQHYILIHGQNDDGEWGPYTAIFVIIVNSPPSAEFVSSSPVYLGEAVEFTNLTTGTLPITYTWDFGDGIGNSAETHPTYTYLTTGSFTVTLSAYNALGQDSISHTVDVLEPACVAFSSVDLTLVTSGTLIVDMPVEFSADLAPDDAGKPFSYTIAFADGLPPDAGSSSIDPFLFEHTFPITGTFPITFSAWNCAMPDPVTDVITVTVEEGPPCLPLNDVQILGPNSGPPGVYTFTAQTSPPSASLPILFQWDNADSTATSTRTLSIGEHTISITATNCATVVVNATHRIVISGYNNYLPLVTQNESGNGQTGADRGLGWVGMLPLSLISIPAVFITKKHQ